MRNLFSFSRPWRVLGGFAVAAALFACQRKSPEEKLLTAVEPAGSWVSTLEMVGQKWTANSVPASFVKNSVSAAHKEFARVTKEASQSEARPELRAAVRGLVDEAQAASAGLRQAVERNDRAAVERETGHLKGLHERFQALSKAQPAQPGG